jgi:hypothetical protein
MSGVPFNAMWTAPLPPSYTDTIGVDPMDYVVLTTSHGDEALVHRDCLLESPVLRFCFRKRVPLATEEVTVDFVATDAAAAATAVESENAGSGTDVFSRTRHSLNAAADRKLLADARPHSRENAEAVSAGGDGPRGSVASEGVDAAHQQNGAAEQAALRRPATLTESLCTDNSVHIAFPRLNRAQLEVLVSYLYYKRHYSRKPTEERPRFTIPPSAALAVMRVAKALNC